MKSLLITPEDVARQYWFESRHDRNLVDWLRETSGRDLVATGEMTQEYLDQIQRALDGISERYRTPQKEQRVCS